MHFTANTDNVVALEPETTKTSPQVVADDVPRRERYGTRRPFQPIPGLSDKALADGELLVASLWVAARAARRLRRQIRAHVRHLSIKAGTADCPLCGGRENDDADGCDLCVLAFYIGEVLCPETDPVSVGELADSIRLFLPHFDVRFYTEQIEKHAQCLRRSGAALGLD